MNNVISQDLAGFELLSTALGILIFVVIILATYLKISTILNILKIGVGFTSLPSVLGISFFSLVLSYFVMEPVLRDIANNLDETNIKSSSAKADKKLEPGKQKDSGSAYSKGANSEQLRLATSIEKWKVFLENNTSKEDLVVVQQYAYNLEKKEPDKKKEIQNSTGVDEKSNSSGTANQEVETSYSLKTLLTAFSISELREAFIIGLRITIPLLIIDLLVATILAAVSVTTISAQLISFPIKLLVFILLDGWGLIIGSILSTYKGS